MSDTPFWLLECRMFQCHINHRQGAEIIGVSQPTFHAKMMGKSPWTVNDMWKLSEVLGIPANEMHLYFPLIGE